jgi:hypothetical protein
MEKFPIHFCLVYFLLFHQFVYYLTRVPTFLSLRNILQEEIQDGVR